MQEKDAFDLYDRIFKMDQEDIQLFRPAQLQWETALPNETKMLFDASTDRWKVQYIKSKSTSSIII